MTQLAPMVINLIEKWVADLANEDYDSAYNRTSQDPYYRWTPELMKSVINGYGLPEPHPSSEVFKVTSITNAKGENRRQKVEPGKYNDNRIGYVHYDWPLNGKWSDLIASYRLEKQGNELTVIFETIHVF